MGGTNPFVSQRENHFRFFTSTLGSVVALTLVVFGLSAVTSPVEGANQNTQTMPRFVDKPFEQMTSGLFVRKTYEADSTGRLRVQIWDLLVGPGKKSEPVELPGAAILEVRSGSGTIILDTERKLLALGTSLSVDEGSSIAFDNSNGAGRLAIRTIVITSGAQ